jgi:HipA-like protein
MRIKQSIIAVNIFLERRKTRMHVGYLKKEEGKFVFTYDEHYLHARNVIPLGPEFPLTKRQFKSPSLFPSLEDRIPSRQNPAYPEYCQAMGIEYDENNLLILLSTIGKRGPSSFVFEPVFERSFTVQEVIEFRNSLGFTTREFAQVFEIHQASLNALERRRSSGKDLLKRLEIIVRFPAVAFYFLHMNGGILLHDKWQNAAAVLKKLGANIDRL